MPEFIPNTETYSLSSENLSEPLPAREPIHIILIGSTVGINLVIHLLHTLGFAEPCAWSKPQISPTSGKPMRILTKWTRLE